MADFSATIKVQIEHLGISTGGGKGAPTASPPPSGGGGGTPPSTDEIREEFRKLAIQIRAAVITFEQLNAAWKNISSGGGSNPQFTGR